MNTHKSIQPISVFFLRTTAQANALKIHIDNIAGNDICKIDHTVVYALHDNLDHAESLFHTISRSLDAFNLGYVTASTDEDWLEKYQTDRSLGIFMMRLTETNDVQLTVDSFRIDCLVRLETQIDGYSAVTDKPESFAQIMLNKAGLGFSLTKAELQEALCFIEELTGSFDFIDYSQLFEDVIRPIAIRSLNENNVAQYQKEINQILSKTQDSGSRFLVIKNAIYKTILELLSTKTSLPEKDIPAAAMNLTKTFLTLKSGFATQALSQEYKAISNLRVISLNTILEPIKAHKNKLVVTKLAKTA